MALFTHSRRGLLLLALLVASSTLTTTTHAAPTVVVSAGSGTVNRAAAPLVAPAGGVVAVVSSPSDDSAYFDAGGVAVCAEAADLNDTRCVVVTSPGATLSGTDAASRGVGAAAAASAAGAIVLTGVTAADCVRLADTRHGRTLSGLFAARLSSSSSGEDESGKILLVLAVEGGDALSAEDEAAVRSTVDDLFDTCVVAAEGTADDAPTDSITVDDLYEVQILSVNSPEDAAEVMALAVGAGDRSPLVATSGNVVATVAQAFARCGKVLPVLYAPTMADKVLLCDDAYVRHGRAVRAKLAAWNGRVYARALPVDRFGAQAAALLTRTMDAYDKDTVEATTTAPLRRLEMRSRLQARLERGIRDLFNAQVENLGKSTLKKFNAGLLRQKGTTMREDGGDSSDDYNDNAAAVRAAAFEFDTAMSDLEVPPLSLKKGRYSQEMSGMLNNALLSFPDSAAAQLKDLKAIKKTAAKSKKPTERSIDAGLGLVAMIRPDGFGNLQGFAGYTAGSNTVTVGVHNDADAPETISQFGGSRPPFLRVQPKLNLDIEL